MNEQIRHDKKCYESNAGPPDRGMHRVRKLQPIHDLDIAAQLIQDKNNETKEEEEAQAA